MTVLNIGNYNIPVHLICNVINMPKIESIMWNNITPLNYDIAANMVLEWIRENVKKVPIKEKVIITLRGHLAACYKLMVIIKDAYPCTYYDEISENFYDIKTGDVV